VDGEAENGLTGEELSAYSDLFGVLLARRDAAEGLSQQDLWHRAGVLHAETAHVIEERGGPPPLDEVSELEARLEEVEDPAEIEKLEGRITEIHAEILRLGKEKGGSYVPYDGEEELEPPFVGSGRRRSAEALAAYWPSPALLRQEHQHILALRQGMDYGINRLIDRLWDEYGDDDLWSEYSDVLGEAAEMLEGDSLAHLRPEMPLEIFGCVLSSAGEVYTIRSRGGFGGSHITVFFAEGDHALLGATHKKGLLSSRDTGGGIPPIRHCKVLKELGFRTVGRPGGRAHPIAHL